MLQRREFGTFDWALFLSILTVSAIGLLMLHSATFQNPALEGLAARQAVWMALGLLALFLMVAIDYQTLAEFVNIAYGIAIATLLYLLLFGRTVAGSRAWVHLGPASLQPAELVKVVLVLAVAAYVASSTSLRLGLLNLVSLAVIGGLPTVLVILQPDFGTAVTFLPALLVTVFVAGIEVRVLLVLLLLMALAIPVAWFTYFKDYQKERILTFVDPSRDPTGSGYQIRQSKIAVGSGGLVGKGLFQGTQSQLQFLPAQHTDFIFAVLAEELGFLGAGGLVALYAFLTLRCLSTARLARDKLGRYVALGFGSIFGGQVLLNLGMVLGLAPIVGIPLPLMSYGGSSVLATLMGFGLVLNVRMRRFVN